jgi:hypothetical protein
MARGTGASSHATMNARTPKGWVHLRAEASPRDWATTLPGRRGHLPAPHPGPARHRQQPRNHLSVFEPGSACARNSLSGIAETARAVPPGGLVPQRLFCAIGDNHRQAVVRVLRGRAVPDLEAAQDNYENARGPSCACARNMANSSWGVNLLTALNQPGTEPRANPVVGLVCQAPGVPPEFGRRDFAEGRRPGHSYGWRRGGRVARYATFSPEHVEMTPAVLAAPRGPTPKKAVFDAHPA